MQFAGIFHKTSEQMSYALNENELIVNLRTGYDVRRVFIHYGDPFESGILGGNEKWTWRSHPPAPLPLHGPPHPPRWSYMPAMYRRSPRCPCSQRW